jgi:hypothetical protein
VGQLIAPPALMVLFAVVSEVMLFEALPIPSL